jgi:hypothetical protein
MRRTIGCIVSEIWAQERALRRLPDSGIVERLDEGRHAEHIRKRVELVVERRLGFLPCAAEELDDTIPFVRGDATTMDRKRRARHPRLIPFTSRIGDAARTLSRK